MALLGTDIRAIAEAAPGDRTDHLLRGLDISMGHGPVRRPTENFPVPFALERLAARALEGFSEDELDVCIRAGKGAMMLAQREKKRRGTGSEDAVELAGLFV